LQSSNNKAGQHGQRNQETVSPLLLPLLVLVANIGARALIAAVGFGRMH
jgi:hypothetical protein